MARLAGHFTQHGRHGDAVLGRRDPDQLAVIAEFLADLNGPPA
jgi:pantothenate synthetase